MKKLFMLMVVAAFFVACSDDDGMSVGGDNGDLAVDTTSTAWMSLKIQNSFTLRSLNTPNEEAGTADETEVKAVKVILFNGPNASSVVTKVIDLSDAEAGFPKETGAGVSGVSDAFKVPASSKTILVIVNPANLPVISAGTATYAQVNAAVNAAASTLTSVANGFMMTNAKGDLEPSDASGNTTTLTLYNDAATAQTNALAINVDRVVAKVRVYIEDGYTSSTATVSDASWILNVTNKSYFPVSKRIKTWNEDPTNAGRGTCISPFDQYKIGSYRIDPNYNDVANWEYAAPYTGYNNNYNYFTEASKPSSWNTVGAITGGGISTASAVQYCLENTQDAANNMHAYTTQVLLKATFLPKGLGLPGTTNIVDVAAGEDWMIINGYYFTYATLMEWIEYELITKYSSADPTTVVTAYTTAFNQYLTDMTLGAVTIPDAITAPSTTAQEQAKAVKDLFEAKETDVTGKGAQQTASVSYYAAGVTYYKIMIKHDDTDVIFNQLGEFGVVRNSVYDIRITKFNNPGDPIIPDPNPTTPDEEDDKYLAVQIKINPWTWYTQSVEL